MMLVCNICKNKGKDISFPGGDRIGTALMIEHFKEEHPEVKVKIPINL